MFRVQCIKIARRLHIAKRKIPKSHEQLGCMAGWLADECDVVCECECSEKYDFYDGMNACAFALYAHDEVMWHVKVCAAQAAHQA